MGATGEEAREGAEDVCWILAKVEGFEPGKEGREFAAAEEIFLVDDGGAAAVLEQGDEEEEAAGGEALLDLGVEIAEEKEGVDDAVEGAGGEGVGGEIEDLRVDGEVLGASAGLDVGDGDGETSRALTVNPRCASQKVLRPRPAAMSRARPEVGRSSACWRRKGWGSWG